MTVTGTTTEDTAAPRKLRVVMAQLDFLVGDIPGNTDLIIQATREAEEQHQADIVLFPELCLTGYPPEDLLLRPSLDLRVQEALERLKQANLAPAMIIGAPFRAAGLLYNAAVVIEAGKSGAGISNAAHPTTRYLMKNATLPKAPRPWSSTSKGFR